MRGGDGAPSLSPLALTDINVSFPGVSPRPVPVVAQHVRFPVQSSEHDDVADLALPQLLARPASIQVEPLTGAPVTPQFELWRSEGGALISLGAAVARVVWYYQVCLDHGRELDLCPLTADCRGMSSHDLASPSAGGG